MEEQEEEEDNYSHTVLYVVILQAAEALIVPLCWEVHSVLALFFTSHYKILCDNQNQFSFSVCCKISLC